LGGVAIGIKNFRNSEEGKDVPRDSMTNSYTFAEEPVFVNEVCPSLNGDG
jgi:hypothetical protein